MKKTLFVLGVLTLGGCATYEPTPKDYAGPVAVIADTGFSEDGTKAQMFALVSVDGNRIENAFSASANASYGRGSSLSTVFPLRRVPARTMKLQLRGSHATGAPIHAIASQMAGTFFSVEGTVEFTPKPDGIYSVRGELKKSASCVWLQDNATNMPVTEKVCEK